MRNINNTDYQRTILVSVLMAYNGLESELEELNSIELKEEYFTGYYRAIVKARNNLLRENPIVVDDMVEEYLNNKNYLKNEFYEMLGSTKQVPLSAIKWYLNKLEKAYIDKVLR